MPPNSVTAESNANSQDNLVLTTSVNAQPMRRETEEFGIKSTKNATAPPTSHYGTVDIVLFAQLEPITMKNSNNAITAQKDSQETPPVTLASHNFETDVQIYRFIVHIFHF